MEDILQKQRGQTTRKPTYYERHSSDTRKRKSTFFGHYDMRNMIKSAKTDMINFFFKTKESSKRRVDTAFHYGMEIWHTN